MSTAAVVTSVQNVDGLMAPDYAVIRLRNGRILLVGDSGVNVCENESDMNDGIVTQGLTFTARTERTYCAQCGGCV